MICDQYGCEHNSKSTCPKCGARVVYVNEDYERRRQAYLEAQARGEEPGRTTSSGVKVPPGVSYSTQEEHNLTKGKDRMTDHKTLRQNQKEDDDVELQGFLRFLGTLIMGVEIGFRFLQKKVRAFLRGMKKKRGKNNPVLNGLKLESDKELTFDDHKETLDTSKLVLAHKVFKDHRLVILVGSILGGLVVIGLVVFLVVWSNLDHGRIMAYLEVANESQIVNLSENGHCMWMGTDITVLDYTSQGQVVLGVQDGHVVYQNKELFLHPSVQEGAHYGQGQISPDGQFYALVGCVNEQLALDGGALNVGEATEGQGSQEASDSQEEYYAYLGDATGNLYAVYEGDASVELVDVTKDGRLLYITRETAAYGVMGQGLILSYDGKSGEQTRLVPDYDDYVYVAQENALYYLLEEKLYQVNLKDYEVTLVDDAVLGLAKDMLSGYRGILYQKRYGYYLYETKKQTSALMMQTEMAGLSFLYNGSMNYVYEKKGEQGTLYTIKDKEPVVYATQVTALVPLDQNMGFLYQTTQGWISCHQWKGKTHTAALSQLPDGVNQAAFGRDSYYILTSEGNLLIENPQKETVQTISKVHSIWRVDG